MILPIAVVLEQLDVPPNFFDGCVEHAINYMFAENYDRKIYLSECSTIEFQTEDGVVIWTTSGEGQVVDPQLPRKVGISILKGKSKIGIT